MPGIVGRISGISVETLLCPQKHLKPKPYLEGQGDLVTRLIMGIIGVAIWLTGVISVLTESP